MTGLHSLTKNSKNKTKRRVGRGGKRGKTSGHGHKGQKQHGRHGIRPELRDMIKKLPKLRGHGINRSKTVNSARIIYTPVNLKQLDTAFEAGDTVTVASLVAKGIVSTRSGKNPHVKILGTGTIAKALTVEVDKISKAARESIEKAGGSVIA